LRPDPEHEAKLSPEIKLEEDPTRWPVERDAAANGDEELSGLHRLEAAGAVSTNVI
jgi:hypothetical protein